MFFGNFRNSYGFRLFLDDGAIYFFNADFCFNDADSITDVSSLDGCVRQWATVGLRCNSFRFRGSSRCRYRSAVGCASTETPGSTISEISVAGETPPSASQARTSR